MSPRIDMVIDSVAWDREPRIRGATHGGKLKAQQKYAETMNTLGVDADGGGEDGGIIYVGVRQKFGIWFVPFYRKADVRLVAVLHLEKRTSPPGENPRSIVLTNGYDESQPWRTRPLYYIKSQQDLYQVNEFFKFFDYTGVLGLLAIVFQLFSTLACTVLALLFWPVSWVEERVIGGNQQRGIVDVIKD